MLTLYGTSVILKHVLFSTARLPRCPMDIQERRPRICSGRCLNRLDGFVREYGGLLETEKSTLKRFQNESSTCSATSTRHRRYDTRKCGGTGREFRFIVHEL